MLGSQMHTNNFQVIKVLCCTDHGAVAQIQRRDSGWQALKQVVKGRVDQTMIGPHLGVMEQRTLVSRLVND